MAGAVFSVISALQLLAFSWLRHTSIANGWHVLPVAPAGRHVREGARKENGELRHTMRKALSICLPLGLAGLATGVCVLAIQTSLPAILVAGLLFGSGLGSALYLWHLMYLGTAQRLGLLVDSPAPDGESIPSVR